jgi:tetratricopeptide (TPR) repeat protein
MTLLIAVIVPACGSEKAPDPPPAPVPAKAGTAAEPASDPEDVIKRDPAYQARKREFMTAYRAGDFELALQLASVAVEQTPDVEEPYIWVGRLAAGVAFFEGLSQRHPDAALAHYHRGHLQWQLRWVADALASFDRAAALDPRDPEAPFWTGTIHHSRGDFDRALEAFRRSHDLEPTSTTKTAQLAEVLRISGSYGESRAVVLAGLTTSPEAAELHYLLGMLHAHDEDAEAAERSLRRAIELDPRHYGAHHGLATLLLRDGRTDEARRLQTASKRLNDYERGLTSLKGQLSGSTDPAVPMLLGELELTAGQFDDALRWFTRAARLGGDSERLIAGHAEACFRAGRTDCGETLLGRLGDSRDSRVELARAARLLDRGETDAALQKIGEALDRAPEEREFLRRAADLCASAGAQDRSRQLLRRAAGAPRMSSAASGL